MTRVAVAASSPVVRAGLEALLVRDESIVLVGESSRARSGLPLADQLEAHDPDVALVELSPDDDILALPVERGERPAFVVLAGPLDAGAVAAALRAGVVGLLPRESAPEQIAAAVRAAAVGMISVSPAYADLVVEAADAAQGVTVGALASPRLVERDGHAGGPELTPREIEVLRMLAEGLANKQIAGRLGISEHTVKFHVAAIFAKLRASSRTEAVTLGVRRGLLML